MKWLYLFLSIGFEVLGTVALKISAGDGKHAFIAGWLVVVFYGLCFWFLQFALKHFEVGVVYATWAGLGVAFIAIIGVIFFNDPMNWLKIASLALVIAGIVGLNLSGVSH